MEFIKVLTIDDDFADSVCIVNKDDISYFELKNYYSENSFWGELHLKNGKEIYVTEEGIKPLQKELLEKNYSF